MDRHCVRLDMELGEFLKPENRFENCVNDLVGSVYLHLCADSAAREQHRALLLNGEDG
jgi:hypothetical protein